MKFSERKGYKPVSDIIQKDVMSNDLRNSLWNVLDLIVWHRKDFLFTDFGESGIDKYSTSLWFLYFKKPVDERPGPPYDLLKEIRNYFYGCKWYDVYDFLTFTLNYFNSPRLIEATNNILEQELSGYRFVGGVCTDITDKQEIEMLDETLQDKDFPSVVSHLRRALELLSDRKSPDYRNSIKESISAVESLAKSITGKRYATLGQALKVLDKSGTIHSAMKGAFSKLYGYTSDKGGIRHAMLDEPNLSASDAKFFLVSCTAFINYMKSKIQ